MLVWSEADVTACLETLPEVDQDATSFAYTVSKDGLRLELTVFPHPGDIHVSLFRDGVDDPVFDITLLECAGIRHVDDRPSERLELAPAKSLENRYDGESPPPFGLSVSVTPNIRLRLFSHAA